MGYRHRARHSGEILQGGWAPRGCQGDPSAQCSWAPRAGSAPCPSNGLSPQVYAGNVLYEHKMPPEPFWEAHDALELQLSSPPAPDMAATLAVTVSFEATCPQRPSRLWKNKGEQHGGMATLGGLDTGMGPDRRGHKAKVSSSCQLPGPGKL